MLTIAKQNNILLEDEYLTYQELINNVQQRLKRDIELLEFEQTTDIEDALEFVNDKGKDLFDKQQVYLRPTQSILYLVTIFRFLKDTEFSIEQTISRLLDTIQWRAENKISRMTYHSVSPEFFENGFA